MSPFPRPGERIGGKYEVVRVLGKGGMGIVYEAIHRRLDQRFAIKMLLPEALERADAVARFEREARAAARLRSPYVVRVLDVDTDTERGGAPYLVMEYVDGHDLAAEIRSRGVIPIAEAVDLLLQACLGAHEAHARGIVHRDIKPSNLFLAAEDGRRVVKVMDFGISKVETTAIEGELTGTDTALGTTNYMAPEQMLAPKSIDHRVDVWALGVVLYRMLSGTLPFSGETQAVLAVAVATMQPVPILERAPQLPHALAAVVMTALTRSRERRPANAIELARLLEPFGSGAVKLAEQLEILPASARVVAAAPLSQRAMPVTDGTVPLHLSRPLSQADGGSGAATPVEVEREPASRHVTAATSRASALPIALLAIALVTSLGLLVAIGGWVVRTRGARATPTAAPPPIHASSEASAIPLPTTTTPPALAATTVEPPPDDAGVRAALPKAPPSPSAKPASAPRASATPRPGPAPIPGTAPVAADPLHL